MRKKVTIIAAIFVAVIALAWIFWPSGRKSGPDSAELVAFKAFLQNPKPICRLNFSPPSGPGSSTKFEAVKNGDQYELAMIDHLGRRSESGLYKDIPWSHSAIGREVLEFYHGWPPELRRYTNQTGGFNPKEEQLNGVLHAGIFLLKPGSLVWEGDSFRGIVKGNIPIHGEIFNFNKAGLPRLLTYTYTNGPSVKIHLEYGNTNVPPFLPSVIRLTAPWYAVFHGRFNTPVIKVDQWQLEEDVKLLDPSARFPKAIRMHYTNNQWMRIEGTNMIPVSNER